MPGAMRIESDRRNPLPMTATAFGSSPGTPSRAPTSTGLRGDRAEDTDPQRQRGFVFHPLTGEWGQCQPMDTGARTLERRLASCHQPLRVGAPAGGGGRLRPAAGTGTSPRRREGLARARLRRSWGIPDQWAFDQPPPATPRPGRHAPPVPSGHAYHSGWIGPLTTGPGAVGRASWTPRLRRVRPRTVRPAGSGVSAGLLTPSRR